MMMRDIVLGLCVLAIAGLASVVSGCAPAPVEESGTPAASTEDSATVDAQSAAPAVAGDAGTSAGLTAADLTGTKWQMGEKVFSFEEEGRMTLNDGTVGEWAVEDNVLTVTALGLKKTARVVDGRLIYEGQPLTKLQ